jgi:hypothetical protein
MIAAIGLSAMAQVRKASKRFKPRLHQVPVRGGYLQPDQSGAMTGILRSGLVLVRNKQTREVEARTAHVLSDDATAA